MKIKSNIKLFFCGLLSFILLLSGMNLIYMHKKTLFLQIQPILQWKKDILF